ncbi:MAG: GAF domain-containing sensor histidine kinase, partial [Gemmatimonadota bacterium]|nr:GAF domain-containing sensor histidine kinase [Gemmatimonadota bacterium]
MAGSSTEPYDEGAEGTVETDSAEYLNARAARVARAPDGAAASREDQFRFIDRSVRAARGRRRPQAATENRALHKLAECAAVEPEDVLHGLLSLLAELVGGGEETSTAGVSLLELQPDGEETFRWVALAGRLAANVGGTTPRHDSPCGQCLDHREPIVLARPDLKYTYFLDTGVEFTEALVVPFPISANGEARGTIWVVSHPPVRRRFDDEDVRLTVSLGSFAASTYRIVEARDIAERANRAPRSKSLEAETSSAKRGARPRDPAKGSVALARQRDIAERMLVSALREQALSEENVELYHTANVARVTAENAQHQAEAANSAKAQFLANMSHELRTPLNAIAGYTELITMGIYGAVTDEQRDALTRIDSAQRHLLRLVNDVLNLARLQAGRIGYQVESLHLADVVAEVDALISPQLREKELLYTVNVPATCIAVGDREKLVQVLLNLLSNAVKFTARGGSVTVECVGRADGSGDPNLVYLRVRDTGLGIALEKLEHIFEPFVQVDTTPAGRAAGVGLGLA